MELIDKSALVVKIEEEKRKISPNTDWYFDEYTNGYIDALKDFLSFLDNLETKEVDLEKEIQLWVEDNSVNGYYQEDVYETAEYFFELGLKAAQKGE